MKAEKIKEREGKIIQFIMDNPYCSLDSIFTKGKIPKSKATKELIKKLVEKKQIRVRGVSKKKYYIKEDKDWVKELENIIKDIPRFGSKVNNRMLEFLKLRVHVLKAEGKKNNDVDIRDTLRILYLNMQHHKNPNKLSEFLLLDSLYWAIEDDKYYMAHQLHSNPTNKKRKFHKATIGSRRSIETLLDMKKKGKQEYGLTGKDFKKNMRRLTNNPHVWFDRFFAEQNRTLYQNSPEIKNDIQKKILDKTKLTSDMPDYENRKKVLNASKEAFPDFPLDIIFDILSEETKVQLREEFNEMGEDFDLFERKTRALKTIRNLNPNNWKKS
ncbi:hypothetical protein [Nitrosopumilus sp.]|uniref:hypothetical protein n=1 Tax=Nitrosopumilus sp. TaxID=2024843 RepID=UPI003D144F40